MRCSRMAFWFLAVFVVSIFSSGPNLSNAQPAHVGDQAPDFTLMDLDGHEITLSDYFGKVIVLTFLGGGCTSSLYEQLPTLQREVYEVYTRQQIMVFGISMSLNPDVDALRALRDEQGIEFPILLDGLRASMEFGIFATPDLVLVGKDGNIRYKETQKIFDEESKAALEQLIAELEVPEIGVQVGNRAPDFTLPDLDWNPVNLYEQIEKYDVVLLYYFSAAG